MEVSLRITVKPVAVVFNADGMDLDLFREFALDVLTVRRKAYKDAIDDIMGSDGGIYQLYGWYEISKPYDVDIDDDETKFSIDIEVEDQEEEEFFDSLERQFPEYYNEYLRTDKGVHNDDIMIKFEVDCKQIG